MGHHFEIEVKPTGLVLVKMDGKLLENVDEVYFQADATGRPKLSLRFAEAQVEISGGPWKEWVVR